MRRGEKLLEIAEKIAAGWLAVDTDEDKRFIEAWKQEDSRHAQLLKELEEPEDFEENKELLSHFPAEEGWQKMLIMLDGGRKRTLRWGKWAGYAALFALLLGGTFFVFRSNRSVPVETTILGQSIPAGKQSARLTLGSGRVVVVTPDKQFVLSEADGTLIRKDSAGINYIGAQATEDSMVNNQMETLTGMEYSLILADGTQVYLNAESCLKYPVTFRGKQRVVELSGEAYFKVAKDTRHPFVVKMQGVELRVSGTSFNARSYANENQVVTTLVEGRVAVNGRPMVPGEQAVYSRPDGRLAVRKVEVEQYVAWQQGKFVFRNERLEDLMKTLARWYGIEYHFMDERAKNIRIGASFGRYENMNPIVDMLKQTELVDVLQTNRSVYISTRK